MKWLVVLVILVMQTAVAQAQESPVPSAVQVDARHTALLVLDMSGTADATRGPCNAETKPRCISSIPAIAGLLASARAHGALVVYSITAKGMPQDIAPALSPRTGEPVVQAGPDKFVGTPLATILAHHAITRVIITGTASEGAVLDTALDAILRDKIDVVVPLDGISSTTVYAETYVAYDLTHAPGMAGHVQLSRCAMIGF